MPGQFMSHQKNAQGFVPVALVKTRSYPAAVAANSATGFGDPRYLAHRRPIRQQALFLCPPFRVMAAVRGRPSGLPGSKFPVRQPAHSCHLKSFGDDQWQLHLQTWSYTYARPHSVQKSRRCTPCNGSRRSTRQLQSCHTSRPLQRTYGQSSRSRSRRRCPMNNALSLALPEDILSVSQRAGAGVPIDAIACAIERADSVLTLLEDHFEGESRLSNRVIAAVIWDVRGTLGLIKTLAMHGDNTSVPADQKGGAL
ncbi:hypothetical protein SAMN03159453_02859 [Pseudomonas sp. NFIX28]|nr:hypothetical protein SAMN03159453_02859 [Pseudomonas sp. NFIX28]